MRNWDATIMSPISWNLKKLTALYIVGVWIYCLYGLVIKDPSKKDDWIVIV
jgi:hypothetical protein